MPSTKGPRYFTIGEAITLFSSTSTARARSMPAFSASSTASEKASIWTARPWFTAIFMLLASPTRADVGDGGADGLEVGAGALQHGRIAADHERELARVQRGGAAGDRRVEQRPAARGDRGGQPLDHRRAHRAHLDEDRARAPAGQQALGRARRPHRSAVSSVTMVKTTSARAATSRGDTASVMPARTRSAAFAAVRL